MHTYVAIADKVLIRIKYSNNGRGPHELSIHRPIVKNSVRFIHAAAIFVSTNPAVTKFHSFDCPTVAIGSSAKLFTTLLPTPGTLAAALVKHSTASRVRVMRGADVVAGGVVAAAVADPDVAELDVITLLTTGLTDSIFFVVLFFVFCVFVDIIRPFCQSSSHWVPTLR